MPRDSSRLASRVRELLRSHPAQAAARDDVRPLDERDVPASTGPHELRYVPDDERPPAVEAATGCVVIERHYDLVLQHGRQPVHHYAEAIEGCLPSLAVLAADQRAAGVLPRAKTRHLDFDHRSRLADDRKRPGVPTKGPLLFFDLETTGLSGGAGTVAFLVGCGYFDAEGFHTRQYFLAGYEAEHELLVSLAALTGQFGGLVTFNGASFDVPLVDTRYLFHRLESPFGSLPHFDMLHPARRLWRRRDAGTITARDPWSAGSSRSEWASCALGSLEQAILGIVRFDDVPGAEIPSRYFHYLRTGDLEPLNAVFEHNRLDLLSLAALTALAMRMVDAGPEAIPTPHEALALGQVYERIGRASQAEACFARAAGLGGAPWDSRAVEPEIRTDALRRLALHRRRHHRFADAAHAWHAVLETGAAQDVTQEARRALAIHHEHRVKDLEAALHFATHALGAEQDPAQAAALRHRIARLERKLEPARNRLKDGGEEAPR